MVAGSLDERDKGVSSTYTLGGKQQVTTVNESGLYDVIFQSRKPEAKRFRRWVTNEVLPAIRKTGAYISDSIMEADDPWELLEIALTEGKKLRDEVRAKNAVIEEQRPAVEFHGRVMENGDNLRMSEMADFLTRNGVRMTQNQLYAELRERGYLKNTRSRGKYLNHPTIGALDKGLFEVVEYEYRDIYQNPRMGYRVDVTPVGQEFFLDLFAA